MTKTVYLNATNASKKIITTIYTEEQKAKSLLELLIQMGQEKDQYTIQQIQWMQQINQREF